MLFIRNSTVIRIQYKCIMTSFSIVGIKVVIYNIDAGFTCNRFFYFILKAASAENTVSHTYVDWNIERTLNAFSYSARNTTYPITFRCESEISSIHLVT